MTSRFTLSLILAISMTGMTSLHAQAVPPANSSNHNTIVETNISKQILEGRILGISKKAKIITLRLEDSVEMIKFDKETTGFKFAKKNENILVRCETTEYGKHAISITPKLAVLPSGVQEIEADALVELIDDAQQRNYLIIDARPNSQYQGGHIPSALSIPLINLQDNPSLLISAKATNKTLIFYSDGLTCGLCTDAARIASQQGHKKVKVLLSGTKGWEEKGELLAISDEMIRKGRVILIDTREPSKVSNGFIPSAINIPPDRFEDSELAYDFPTQRNAPIVLYGTSTDVTLAEKTIAEWGYRRLRQVDGGYAGWEKRGGGISLGSAPGSEGISWNNEINESQISKQDFKKLMKTATADTIILDVRTTKEVNKGRIKNSINIPLEDLSSRKTEFPSNKKIITHCATGSRAEMAALFLDEYVDDVRFLSAKVRCKGEKCRIK